MNEQRNTQVAFDLYAPFFSTEEIAQVSGASRSTIDIWLHRGVIEPTRRVQASRVKPNPKGKRRGPRGRPMFSLRDIFKARMIRELTAIGLGSSESVEVADEANAAEIAETVAYTGEWMWACARNFEQGHPINMYAYATRSKGKMLFDMHFGETGTAPCFGWQVPHVFIPISEIFIVAYLECKKILGEMETTGQDYQ